MDGKGKMTNSSGSVYEGCFCKGVKHGFGKLTFTASGDINEGNWQEGKMNGQGKYFFAKENKTYEGDFVEGAPYGRGIMKCDEFYYEGQFKSGLFEGQGKL